MSKAQDAFIESIQGQPAPEVYDLFKDSKGYLWLTHELGVSRYDGSAFINLNNAHQNSFAMTDLVEDKKDRIWCHNFTGQIFYIENLKLHLLTQYKYREEQGFPRILICGDELIATSIKGIFVYNTLTGQSKYLTIPGGTSSLVKVGNKVIVYSKHGWYSYESGKSIRKLLTGLHFTSRRSAALQPVSYRDTFYLIVNPTSTYYKLTLNGDSVKIHAENKTSAFLNTISVDGDNVWVHTKRYSFTTDRRDFIDGMNLSDVITESTGHKWMSSLKQGLCMQFSTHHTQKLNMAALGSDDYVRRMHATGGRFFLTTANGKLYELTAANSLSYILSIPRLAGIIEHMTAVGPDQFVLTASVGMYLYDSKKRQLRQFDPSYNIKDITVHDGKLYAATGIGVRYCSLEKLFSKSGFLGKGVFGKEDRSKSIAFAGDSLIMAFSEGLYLVYKDRFSPILYNQSPIYAVKVRTIEGKVLVGTYNQGLLIIENGRIRSLTEKEGLASNNIKDIKIAAGQAWIIYHDYFQQLNNQLTGIESNTFNFTRIAGINDLGIWADKLFVAASEGVYSINRIPPVPNMAITTYIDKVIANGKDQVGDNKLAYFQNHLQFHVSTPFYSPYSKISYQYRIRSLSDSVWQMGTPGQSAFDVIALKPGKYTFEIVAVDKSKRVISRPAVYEFEIVPPWYQTWTFRGVISIIIIALGFFLIRLYYNARLRKQRIEYEKILAVQAERQRISSEIHDDIGAGLSAIRLLTEMTKNRLPESDVQKEVSKIHASVSELSQKMREVIWSLNTDNDYLENLLYYIQRLAIQLFENSPIHLKVTFPVQQIPDIVIKGDKRRHIYLAVKEALHNCLKHSTAENCRLSMDIEGNSLLICITDDGKGFVPMEKEKAGNGLKGMKRRMQQINGYFEVQSNEKIEVRFTIPLKEKL